MRLLVIFSILFVSILSCQSDTNSSTLISGEEMKELMVLDSVQLIDVRSLEEFREGHLQGSQNLIYDEDFAHKIKQLDKSKPVAVYCKTGRRSEHCSQILKEAGFKKIYQLEGGLSKWKFEKELVKDTLAQ